MTKDTNCCNSCYNKVEEKIGEVFSRYGIFVARNPWKIIFIGVLLNGIFGIGVRHLNVVIDVERVYTPIGSQASKDTDRIRELFPDISGTTFVSHQIPDLGRYGEVIVIPKGGDILDGTFLTKLIDLYSFILAIETTDCNGASVTLNDICAKIHGACSVDGSLFVDTNFISDVNASNPIPFPFYAHPTQGQIYYEQLIGGAVVSPLNTLTSPKMLISRVIGGAVVSPSNTLTSAKMLILRVNLRTDSDYYVDTAKNWQESFLEKIKDYSSEDFDISYSHTDSLKEEQNDSIAEDIVYFSITFTVIITYACVATMTARCDVVGQKSYLGFAGVIAAGLAIVSAFGVGSNYGVEFVSTVGFVPFLIIVIGVDDMFMLMSGITNADYRSDVESRIGETMKTSGVSITITTLTYLLAFAAGASSVFLSVRNFCIYCAIAVIFCYTNQATIFLASIAINEKRTEDNRHYSSCLKVMDPEEVDKNEHSKCYLLCCSGRKPRNVRESESLFDRFPKWLIPKLTMPLPAKILILVAFAIYLGVSIWGCTRLEQGLILKDLVSRDSFYYVHREHYDNNFPEGTVVSLVIEETLVYSNANVQSNIESTLSTMRAESTVQDFITISWLDSYKVSSSYSDTSESTFITGLQTFLSQPENARFINDVVINNSNTSITASRFYVISESITDSQEQGSFMLKMRDIVSDSSLPAFAFSPAFLFYEQYVVILSQTLQTLGIAVAMVFVVTCIFMPHPLLLLYVTATVAMITCGIFGFIAFLGLKLNAITMTHVIMSIGFSVDFSAHICHGYMISSGETKNERMVAGIKRSGAPIFHGAISTILGVILLAFAKSFIFYSFFQVMSLVITFGILHALLLLPVILSLIGPSNLMGGSTSSVSDESESINGVYNNGQELSSSKINVKIGIHN